MNFSQLCVVDKTRCIWNYRNCEIAVDSVAGLGDYIEIEYKGSDDNINNAHIILFDILRKIPASVAKKDEKGYPWQLIETQTSCEPCEDIT